MSSHPPARPPRALTPDLWERLRATPHLTLHRALLLGIADPVPNPSPMSEDDGQWVRHNVWPAWMREIEHPYPFGYWRWTNCQRGRCWNCINSRCDLCIHRHQGGPSTAQGSDYVSNHNGTWVAPILRPDHNPTCVWMCRCPCPTTGSNVTTNCDTEQVRVSASLTPPRDQPALFDLETP